MTVDRDGAVGLFTRVRDLPYATDGAHDADSLMRVGRGDCLAKSAYLIREFRNMGIPVRRTRWLYHLPPHPAEVALLPSREDVHTALEVRIEVEWVLVDATHDPGLAHAGLAVAEGWDGSTSTVPAYPPTGPVWREGDTTPEPTPNAWQPSASNPVAGRIYQVSFNQWLRAVRNC